MTHYDINANVKLRCDGDHEWGKPFLSDSGMEITYDAGVVYVKLHWTVRKKCTNDHTNDGTYTSNKCRRQKTVDRGSEKYPIEEIEL
jgi:hypothetical protein